jgi:hypothetical protein
VPSRAFNRINTIRMFIPRRRRRFYAARRSEARASGPFLLFSRSFLASALWDFERGVREPDLLTLKAYTDVAGVSLDDLADDNIRVPTKLPGAKRTD